MKVSQLLKRKHNRHIVSLLINIVFIIFWLKLNTPVLGPAPVTKLWIGIYAFVIGEVNPFSPLLNLIHQLVRFIPILIVTRWIWWGRQKKKL